MTTGAKDNSIFQYKWMLVGLLWFAYFLNQGDRQIFNTVIPLIKENLGLTDYDIGDIVMVFTAVYGVLLAGSFALVSFDFSPVTDKPGDTILGLASSGPHSNGFSLIRKVVEVAGADWNMPFDGATLADRAMEPTRIYVKQVLEVMKSVKIKGMAHITGGGLVENVPRVLPEGVQAVIDGKSWTRPAIFDWLQEKGNIDSHEMHRVFNNGIGLVVIVSAEDAEKARGAFEAQGEKVFTIGTVAKLPEGEAPCVVR